MAAIFVTGTDTGVGKTLVSKILIEHFVSSGLRVAAMKPVASGAIKTPDGLRNDDAETLLRATNTTFDYSQINPYVFEPAIAPHIAASQSNSLIDVNKLDEAFSVLSAGSDKVIIEGAGGWQVPLNHSLSFADWVSAKQWPLVLVVGIRLGCINHAQLTCLDILQKKNPLLGWVANIIDPGAACQDEIIHYLEESIDAPLLGKIPFSTQAERQNMSRYLVLDRLLGNEN